MSGEKPDLARHPNAKARPLALDFQGDKCYVSGYQEFRLDRLGSGIYPPVIPTSERLRRQKSLLGPYMARPYLAGKSFLDLGASAGFWSFLAASQGAGPIWFSEMDEEYHSAIRKLADWSEVRLLGGSVPVQWLEKKVSATEADVVHALGLLHWLYCCTADYGSLEAIIGHLASLTRERLHVEWIAPEDPMIQDFGHLDWNPEVIKAPYTEEHFLQALFRHFAKAERLGEHTKTRHIWVAWK